MGLIINQTYAKIGINRIPGKMDMKTRKPELQIKQKHALLKMESSLSRIRIDQSESFASAGLKKPVDLSKMIAQSAYQYVMQYIAKLAQDGDRLAAIENGGNAIADIAQSSVFDKIDSPLDYGPPVMPKISVQEGYVKIDPGEHGSGIVKGVEFSFTPGDVEYDYTPTKIEIYMRQYNSIKFEYRPEKIDTYV